MNFSPTIATVSVKALAEYVDPMRLNTWQCGVIDVEDVECCEDPTIGAYPAGSTAEDASSWEYNVARIAWLAARGWKTPEADSEPITLLVTASGALSLVDGNHRLAAAIVRGDKEITVLIEGAAEDAYKILGI